MTTWQKPEINTTEVHRLLPERPSAPHRVGGVKEMITINIPDTDCWFSAPRDAIEEAMQNLSSAPKHKRVEYIDECWRLLSHVKTVGEEQQKELAQATIYAFANALLYERGEDWLAPAPHKLPTHFAPEARQ